jgi:hypothetical protein
MDFYDLDTSMMFFLHVNAFVRLNAILMTRAKIVLGHYYYMRYQVKDETNLHNLVNIPIAVTHILNHIICIEDIQFIYLGVYRARHASVCV